MPSDSARRLPPPPRLPPAMPRSGVSPDARVALRQVLGDLDRGLALAFREGVNVRDLVRRRAEAIGDVVVHVWRACVGEAPGCALFAVGGFGRRVLFPHSDVDLLVLAHADAVARQARALEACFTCLWDIGLKPGHAVRTLLQCRDLAAEDVTVFTALLDARLLAGEAVLADGLRAIVDDPASWPPARFFAAKRAEQAARHTRYDDTAYNLEPNLKESPGGLRTLDLMRWLGLRLAGAGDFSVMAERGLLDATERAALERSEAALWRVRFALHLAAGRAEERLLFDHQRRLAADLGHVDEAGGNLAVEQFMQRYYRAATIASRLGEQFAERCAEQLEPQPPPPPRTLNEWFVAIGTRLEPRDGRLFLQHPRAIVEAFATLLDHRELGGFSAQTMRLLQRALAQHRGAFAEDRAVLAAFLALLRRGAPAVDALAAMNRHGVLAALLPPFRRIVGRMQYDLFHAYTVDEHTQRVLRNVARFASSEAAVDMPLASQTFASLDKPELLLLAALFHDIAKGRGGDHSVLGKAEARAFGLRLGLPAPDVELVAWLVRWHLLMSVTAQRQDITDPEVVHRFAAQVEDTDRLDHLYLLTIADIAGTHPRLWNEWKARLLADLHVTTRYALRAGLEPLPRSDERAAACRARALERLLEQGIDDARANVLLDGFPSSIFLRHRPRQIAWQAMVIDRAGDDALVVAVQTESSRGGSVLFVRAVDRDGLFAAIAATLDRLGFDVVEARLLASPRGMVFDTFQLLDSASASVLTPERAVELETTLRRVLSNARLEARIARRNLPRRLRHFQRAPQIGFNAVGDATQLALVCIDRPGLLAQVAQALREARVRVHDARIASFGERVEDFFVVTDENDRGLDADAQRRLRDVLLRTLDPNHPQENPVVPKA